ncbi:RNA polymerase sigma factor sigC [Dichanthelium oligosanthes]|uniref:RNA polymerase sigma factor sigC n=1 Tax=Dichanthelium oligosanthes TaxID=888268 RepID=A0A1E5VUN6_9POAL|nr:RNA polymerase sigma factor sigC [Dichanthelium oligosanthes]
MPPPPHVAPLPCGPAPALPATAAPSPSPHCPALAVTPGRRTSLQSRSAPAQPPLPSRSGMFRYVARDNGRRPLSAIAARQELRLYGSADDAWQALRLVLPIVLVVFLLLVVDGAGPAPKAVSPSMATLDTLTQTSHEQDCSLIDKIIKFDPETPLEEQDAEVIVRSGKSHERKQKRMRALEKGSRISVKVNPRRSKKSRKSSSSQFISEWKNCPGRRRTIVREQSALLVTIKECANLEKIRENMVKEGEEVSYHKWAEAAGIDEAELISRLQEGYFCRERLLVTTEWLVRYIARTYTGMGTAFDDLLQAGKIGVLDGAEKFDSRKGCKFSTYVKYWIRKGMLAILAENSGVTVLPARMESIIRKVKEARRAIRYSQGRSPSDSEIAAMVGVSVANVRLARKCSRRVVSLYSEIGIGQNAKFAEVIPDACTEAPDEAIFRAQLRERLLVVLDRLPAREGHVLKLRHGLEDGRCMSLEQIGGIYRVSKEWIRKIEKSAMAKLRNQDVRRELDDFSRF